MLYPCEHGMRFSMSVAAKSEILVSSRSFLEVLVAVLRQELPLNLDWTMFRVLLLLPVCFRSTRRECDTPNDQSASRAFVLFLFHFFGYFFAVLGFLQRVCTGQDFPKIEP